MDYSVKTTVLSEANSLSCELLFLSKVIISEGTGAECFTKRIRVFWGMIVLIGDPAFVVIFSGFLYNLR